MSEAPKPPPPPKPPVRQTKPALDRQVRRPPMTR